jgi:hypothetical protein
MVAGDGIPKAGWLSRHPFACFRLGTTHVITMSRRKRRPPSLPIMVAELMFSSWETVALAKRLRKT